MPKLMRFPSWFYFGASTSAHQVEGGNKNDWTLWEKDNAPRLSFDAKRHLKLWQLELFPESLKPQNYVSGDAADHYNRYESDFDIAKKLNHNAQRLSIEWSRIEPKEGKFDKNEIEHYRSVISSLKKRGIEPIVTLWHFTNPIWFKELGGWASRKAPRYFSRYVAKIANELGRDVKYWITINEPMVYASHSYLKGKWPPQKRSIRKYFKVIRHLASAHRHSANAIKIIDAGAMVGIAKHNIYFESVNGGINGLLKKLADFWWNHHFLNDVKKHIDFIGLNNYFLSRVRYGFDNSHDNKVSDLGWGLYPESVYQTLRGLKRYKKPIFITENGLADARDTRRALYIKEVLRGVLKAIDEGIDVRGYLYWSLLDNFEWDKGFWPRFGLIEVDYKTQERKVRESAKEYAKIIKSGAID